MNIDTSALTKTGMVVLAIWGFMFASDMSRNNMQAGASGNLIDKARELVGFSSSSGVKAIGLTLAYQAGKLPVIVKVDTGSEAEKAGLKVGDKIKAINRLGLTKESELEQWVSENSRPGMSFIIDRNGKTISGLKLGQAPIVEQPAAPHVPVVGLEVQDMPGMYPAGVHAPFTMNPYPGELADKAGVKGGEWIVAVNGESISTAAEYRAKTEGQGPLRLTVLNTNSTPYKKREVQIRQ